jgi:hypothetical protein
MAEPAPQTLPLALVCPSCCQAVEATPGVQPTIVNCPHCNQAIIVPAADGSMPAMARAEGAAEAEPFVTNDLPEQKATNAKEDLDANRIRQVTQARRSAYRTRSYVLILIVACIVVAIQLVIQAFIHIETTRAGDIRFEREPFGTWPFGKLMVSLVLLAVAYRFWGRAGRLKREADRSAITEPSTPPDLSKLSDGSQHYKNLDELNRDRP